MYMDSFLHYPQFLFHSFIIGETIVSVDVGSASPKESHFGWSFHTSSVMCFQTEACTCNRSLASVLLASQKTPTIDSCTEPTYQLASLHYSAS